MKIFGISLFEKNNNLSNNFTNQHQQQIEVKSDIPDFDDINDSNSLWTLVSGAKIISEVRSAKLRQFKTMGYHTTINSALEMMSEDATQLNQENRKIFWVTSETPEIEEHLNDFLTDQVRIQERLFLWAYRIARDGECYLKTYFTERENANKLKEDHFTKIEKINSLNESNFQERKLKQELIKKSVLTIEEKRSLEVLDDDEYYEEVQDSSKVSNLTLYGKTSAFLFIENDGNSVIFKPQDYIHFVSDRNMNREDVEIEFTNNDKTKEKRKFLIKYGTSFLEGVVQDYNVIELLENVLVVSRLSRSQLFRLFLINVGASSNIEALKMVRDFKNSIKNRESVDVKSGKYVNTSSPLPISDNIFIPTRQGKGDVSVQDIGGNVDVKSIVDFDFFWSKFCGALRVPKAYLCLRGNTKVSLLDGTTPTLAEMSENSSYYVGRSILTCDATGEIKPTTITHVHKTRLNASFVRVTLDNNEFVDFTPDHLFQMRDGSFKEAGKLLPDDSLMPFYTRVCEKGYSCVKRNNKSGGWVPIHRLMAKSGFLGEMPKGYVVHHKDKNKLNNDASNLEVMSRYDYYKKHSEEHIKNRLASFLKSRAEKFSKSYSSVEDENFNSHKVLKVEFLNVVEDAYDLGVDDDSHTFPLACGIFVHNSFDDAIGGQYSNTSLTRLDIRYARTVKRIVVALQVGIEKIIDNHLETIKKEDWKGKYKVVSTPVSDAEESDRLQDLQTKIEFCSTLGSVLTSVEGVYSPLEQKAILRSFIKDKVGIDVEKVLAAYLELHPEEEEVPVPAEDGQEQDPNQEAAPEDGEQQEPKTNSTTKEPSLEDLSSQLDAL